MIRFFGNSISAIRNRSIVSYGGRGEDMFFLRFFKNHRQGLYLDIGAAHPKYGNTTFLLYKEMNWCGLAIEPREGFRALWNQQRPRDKFLASPVYSKQTEGLMTNSGFRSEFIPMASNQSFLKGESVTSVTPSYIKTLWDDIFAIPPNLIKIDIENLDDTVALGLLEVGLRSDLLVVETMFHSSTHYESRINIANLEISLQDHGYVHIMFDGINDYFVHLDSPFVSPSRFCPAYPGTEQFIPFHLTSKYRLVTQLKKILKVRK